MQIKTFVIPVTSPERSEGDANRFLRSHRVNRGGSWNNNARNCRVSNRANSTPSSRTSLVYGVNAVGPGLGLAG